MDTDIRVLEMDGVAWRHLTPLGKVSGYVHSCFDHAINFKVNGKLLTVHPNRPAGPMTCLVGENDFLRLSQQCQPGMAISGRDSFSPLRLAILDYQGQPVARLALDEITILPPCRVPRFPGKSDDIARTGQAVERFLHQFGGASIFGPPSLDPGGRLDRLLRSRARRIIRGVGSALRAASMPSLRQQLHAAIALGPGLTPAGDDFCYGVLAAELSCSLAGGSRFTHRNAAELARQMAAHARMESTEFSASFLEQLSDGYIFPAVRDVLTSSLTGDRRTREALNRLADCGHSSGFDMLAGIHLSLDASIKSNKAVMTQAGGNNNVHSQIDR